ncbi:hypothetical protein ACRAWG_05810 [Methylobacterium sp. P31]
MASIKIRAAGDGTFAVCRDGTALASGLTREQAEQFVTVLSWIRQAA